MKSYCTYWCLFISLILFVLPASVSAQKQDSIIKIFSNLYSWASSTVMDANSNITIGGIFEKSAYIKTSSQVLTGNDNSDAYVARIDKSGNLIWKKVFGGKGDNEVKNIVIDRAGNCYITGFFNSSFTVDGVQFDSVNANNGFIAKLDNTGNLIWAKTFLVYNYNFPNSLYCNNLGDIYLGLFMNDSLKIGNNIYKNNNMGNGSLLLKFDPIGNLLWSRVLINHNGSFVGLCGDNFGHLYIGGYFTPGVINWGPDNIPGKKDTLSTGLFLAKLNENNGNMLWFREGQSNNFSRITNILIGGDGSLYTAGFFADTLNMQGFKINTVSQNNPGTPDIIVMNFDTLGHVLWHQFFGSDEPQYVNGFCLDNNDNVYVAGIYDIPITFGTKDLFTTKARDGYLMRFEKEGSFLGSTTTKALTNNSACGFQTIMIDSRNKLYVTGNINYETQIGDDTLTCPGSNVGFIWSVHSSFNGIEPENVTLGQSGITIYPNPLNSNILNIKLFSPSDGVSIIECLDASGKIIYNQRIFKAGSNDAFSIEVPDIKPGFYIIKVITDTGLFTQQFLKN